MAKLSAVAVPCAAEAGFVERLRADDPTGVTSRGCEEAKRRIAAALGTPPGTITLDHHDLDLSGWSFHANGSSQGKGIFAKIFLHGFNPPLRRIPRYVTPLTDLHLLLHPDEPFGGSVDNEYRMLSQIGPAGKDVDLPVVLGKSDADGTLVFEEVRGIRLDAYAKFRRWNKSTLSANTRRVGQAAIWLRKLHDDTFDGSDKVDPLDLLRTIHSIITLRELDSNRYGEMALSTLKAYTDAFNSGTISVPRCICHGDFALVNLLWDPRGYRLTVIDFEHSVRGNVLHDLCSFIFDLRSRLLNPFTFTSVVKIFEEAFWAGYGPVSEEIVATVNALATARIFYFLLPRLIDRCQRRGWLAGAEAALYIRWFEPAMVDRILKCLEWPGSNSRYSCHA